MQLFVCFKNDKPEEIQGWIQGFSKGGEGGGGGAELADTLGSQIP